jgi:hypothetical protein
MKQLTPSLRILQTKIGRKKEKPFDVSYTFKPLAYLLSVYVCVWHRDATLRRVARAFVDSAGVVVVPPVFSPSKQKSWWGRKKKKKKSDFSSPLLTLYSTSNTFCWLENYLLLF